MSVTPVRSEATQAASTASTSSRTDELSSATFLSLLTAQLQNQDPLEPMTGEAMLNQISQMTSVSELMKLNDNFASMAQQGTNVTQVATLLGRRVEWLDATGNAQSGTVTRVQNGSGGWEVKVGDTTVSLDDLRAVE